jgi:putative peptide zinc metalloprotease protein
MTVVEPQTQTTPGTGPASPSGARTEPERNAPFRRDTESGDTAQRSEAQAGRAAADQSAPPAPVAASPATEPTAEAPAADPTGALAAFVPRPAPGTEFFGEYQDSGYTQPRYLVQRADGQVIQLTLLLELTLHAIDGAATRGEIARRVTAGFGREVTAENIAYLIEHKLQPAGLVLPEDGAATPLPRTDLLLALRGHCTLFRPPQVRFLARMLAWMHRPLVVVSMLLGVVALDVWLFGVHGAAGPLVSVITSPLLMLAVLGLGIASMVFHEFGHASACHYSGARPGRIGCGIFLVWPSMYTDVTDVYRVGRVGRLRTDLGGVYFNSVFILALAGCYALTGHPVFLAAILFVHFEIVDQLLPILRFDGYFLLADLVGVPDLYGRVRPILRGLLPARLRPGGRAAGNPSDLRRGARVAATAWVLVTLPLLVGEFVWMFWHLPSLSRTTAHSISVFSRAAYADSLHHHWAQMGLDGFAVALLAIPMAGLCWLAVKVVSRLLRQLAHRLRPPLALAMPRGRHQR